MTTAIVDDSGLQARMLAIEASPLTSIAALEVLSLRPGSP
jgi:hypothetical protein